MRALVKATAGPGLELREVPCPEIGINDVLIRVHRTGICGTDLHIESWDAWAARTIQPPLVVGHEFVGDVVEVGSNVTDFQPGDLVSGEGHVVCGRCRHCLAGRRHLCANTIGLGVDRDGAFAEYVALPMTNVWHHWPGIDPEVAAIFDPFGNAVHTALAFPVLGEDVLVTGAGPIGLMATAVARHAGRPRHRRRQRAEPVPARARHADGRDVAIDPRERDARSDVCAELGLVEGFDVALEMSGNADGAPLRDRAMAHGGGIAILGIPTAEITLDVSAIVFKMLTRPRHLRPRDVRDLVQDDGDAPVGPRHPAGDHPPLRRSAISRRRSPRPPPATPARSLHGLAHEAGARRRPARPDPLAFLADELADLRRAAPLPPAPGDELGPGPDRRRRRAGGCISLSLERLPRPDPPSRALRGRRSPRSREFGVGSRRGPDDRRHDDPPRGARGGRSPRFKQHRGGPDLPVRLHRQHRRDPDDHRRGAT